MSTLPCRGTMEGWAFRLDDGVNGFSPTLLMHSFLSESASDYFPIGKRERKTRGKGALQMQIPLPPRSW